MSGEGVPFMVTAAMKQELRERGFTDDEICNLTPQWANHILKNEWTHKQWADYEETIQAGRDALASAKSKGRKEEKVVPIRPGVGAKLAERTKKVIEGLDATRKLDEELKDLGVEGSEKKQEAANEDDEAEKAKAKRKARSEAASVAVQG